jgi:hypothetical protein
MSLEKVKKRNAADRAAGVARVYPEHARIPVACRRDGLPATLYISGGSLGNVTLTHNGSFWAGVTDGSNRGGAGDSVKFVCATDPVLSVSAEPGTEPTIEYPCKPVRSPSGWAVGNDGEMGYVTE